MRGVGIVTAMRMESRCITRLRLPFNQRFSLGESAAIWVCGMGAEAAREAAEGLKTGGASALMSFGFAGALEPGLRPGDLVLPESIHAGRLLGVDLSWRASVRLQLPGHLSVVGGVLAASGDVLTSRAAKCKLAQATGACAVDMESGAVAEAAARAGIPFLAVRAISDPLGFSPPPALLGAVRADGSADLARVLPLLLRRSVSLGILLRLAADARSACSTLSAVARHVRMEMGIASN
ncbi:MAG: phosphorylase [Nitrosospira sp.]|nr:phosphorylase [Nitrosospira sp.]